MGVQRDERACRLDWREVEEKLYRGLANHVPAGTEDPEAWIYKEIKVAQKYLMALYSKDQVANTLFLREVAKFHGGS